MKTLALIVSSGCAALAGVQASLPAAKDSAAIAGMVLSADSARQPVAGVLVRVSGNTISVDRAALTRDDGTFIVTGLPAGEFTVRARKPGYLDAYYGASRPGRSGVTFRVGADERLSGLALSIWKGSAIAGTVRGPDGRPVPGAEVAVYRVLASGRRQSGSISTATDDRGRYRLYGLQPGDYLATASFPRSPFLPDVVTRSAGEIDAILAALAGRTAVPRPLRGTAASTDSAGSGSLASVFYPGVVDSTYAGRISVESGDSFETADFRLQSIRLSVVEGNIQPATPGIVVALTPAALDSLPAVRPQQVQADQQGHFRFAGVGPGAYLLEARSSLIADRPFLWGRSEIEIRGTGVPAVVMQLQPAFSLAGKVRLDELSAQPENPTGIRITLSNPRLEALRAAAVQGLLSVQSVSTSAQVDRDGAVRWSGLVPGSYWIDVSSAGDGWLLSSAMFRGQSILDQPLELRSEPQGDVLLRLTRRGAAVSGRLHHPASHSALSYFAVLFPADTSGWGVVMRRTKVIAVAPTGEYEFAGLRPGHYLIAVVTGFEQDDLADPSFFAALRQHAVRVQLAEGERKRQELWVAGD
jgi:hypothetical protein